MRIVSFRHRGLERFWRSDDARGLPAKNVEKLRAMLTAITEAANIREIERFSGWRLHPLKGNRQGTWGMVLTRNQRVTFVLRGSTIEDLGIEDYH
jgi:proteic killer suppression protein